MISDRLSNLKSPMDQEVANGVEWTIVVDKTKGKAMKPNDALKIFALMLGDRRNERNLNEKKARLLAEGTSPLLAIYQANSTVNEESIHEYQIYRIHKGKELLSASLACSVDN